MLTVPGAASAGNVLAGPWKARRQRIGQYQISVKAASAVLDTSNYACSDDRVRNNIYNGKELYFVE